MCPKCGSNQHERPKQNTRKPTAEAKPRRRAAPMAPLLDEEEEVVVEPVVTEEEGIGLGLSPVDEADEAFISDDAAAAEDEEEES